MALVVVERSFERETNVDELAALERAVACCFETHRVKALRSMQARDGRRMVCIYEAPDAEAVRVTQREGGLPFERVWGALHVQLSAAEPPERHVNVVVQRVMPQAVSAEMARAVHAQSADCYATYRVRPLETYVSIDGLRTVCRFSAPDAEAVRLANTQSGTPLERAWPAVVLLA